MNDAPERIWINEPKNKCAVGFGEPSWDYNIEYVRADKLEELASENNLLVSNFKELSRINEASLAEKDKEIVELRELVDSAENIFRHCTVSDGVCCCGDNMENHPSPMSCGHTPVDHGAYQVDLWIQARNAGGTDG